MAKRNVWLIAALFGCALFASVAAGRAYAVSDEPVVVSFGDSYSAGEGNDPYYGQDSKDKYKSEDWLAHRSRASWSGQLHINGVELRKVKYSQEKDIEDKGAKWFFYASSGAVAVNVYNREKANEREIELRGSKNEYQHAQKKTGKKNLFGDSFEEYVEVQLKEAIDDLTVNNLSGDDVDYVTMSIGGNDIGFAGIVGEVAVRNSIIDEDYLRNSLNDAWYNFDRTIPYGDTSDNFVNSYGLTGGKIGVKRKDSTSKSAKEEILECYRSIREEFPNAEVFIVGYPTLLDDRKFDEFRKHWQDSGIVNKILALYNMSDMIDDMKTYVGFADWEASLINSNARKFNECLESLVSEIDGSFHFVSVETPFDGHEHELLYSVRIPQAQDLTGFSVASAASVHPNPKGVIAYRDAVQDAIDALPKKSAATSVVNSAAGVASGDSGSQVESGAARDIAMVLDVSGSMAGEPLDATKNAATKFVNVALDNDAQTALVAYDEEAEILSRFSTNESTLKSAIGQITDGGGTNIESGIVAAKGLLDGGGSGKKYMVFMSDGDANQGLVGDKLMAYAQSVRDPNHDGRDDIIIYSLGFNESGEGERILKAIASDGCYFPVRDSADLEAFFQDMGDMISGDKYMYAKVACPVDVSVTHDGETLSSAGDEPKTRTSFGSLAFEENESGASDDPVKVLRLREGESYDISISGTGEGTMSYSLGLVDDEGYYSDFRTFSNIPITEQTKITTTAEAASTTMLAIDEDGDGAVDKRYRASANQEGELVDSGWIVRLVVAGFVMVGLVVVGLAVWKKMRGLGSSSSARGL